jgi:hypothetical protein
MFFFYFLQDISKKFTMDVITNLKITAVNNDKPLKNSISAGYTI